MKAWPCSISIQSPCCAIVMCIGAAAGFRLVPEAWRMRKSAVASGAIVMPLMSLAFTSVSQSEPLDSCSVAVIAVPFFGIAADDLSAEWSAFFRRLRGDGDRQQEQREHRVEKLHVWNPLLRAAARTSAGGGGSDQQRGGEEVEADVLIAAESAEGDETAIGGGVARSDARRRRGRRGEAERLRHFRGEPLHRLLLFTRGNRRLMLVVPAT